MSRWDAAISIETEKILRRSQEDLGAQIRRNAEIASNVERVIDRIVNRLSRRETLDVLVHTVRQDRTLQEWEATFAAINMCSVPTVQLILEGLYLQACALVRQELEGLARLGGVKRGETKEKKVFPVSELGKDLSSYYGELSTGAHLASLDAVLAQSRVHAESAAGFALLPHGSSLLPTYDERLAAGLFAIHLDVREALSRALEEHAQLLEL